MIILDTNVISELLRESPSRAVVTRVRGFRDDERYTTAINEGELRVGLAALPSGQRSQSLRAKTEALLDEVFAGRILSFDSAAAKAYAELRASRRAAGRPILLFDAQIAAIAQVYGAVLVTRNTRDFEACGFELINPWN